MADWAGVVAELAVGVADAVGAPEQAGDVGARAGLTEADAPALRDLDESEPPTASARGG